jgi:methionyl-tRNA formyltransferase
VVSGVIYAQNTAIKNIRFYKKKIFKIFEIGILGALNGVRIRKWFLPSSENSIITLCEKLNIPLFFTDNINSIETRKHLSKLTPDLGVSLGNSYISSKVFRIPKYGMINIHTEILPKYQGAHSVIWPIFYMERNTGFTIHEINKSIDTGKILYLEKIPISFHQNLKNTVYYTSLDVSSKLSEALTKVCENIHQYKKNAIVQEKNKTYTTPTFLQFVKMIVNNRKLYKKLN